MASANAVVRVDANARDVGAVATWSVSEDSAAATAKTITKAAETGKTHYITSFEAVVSAAAITGDCSIELRSASTRRWLTYLGNAAARGTRVGNNFNPPMELAAGEAANLVAASGGTGAVVSLSMAGFTL